MSDLNPMLHGNWCANSHPASWPEEKLLAQSRLSFSRASGPGGQNRNKVETSVQIEYLPAGILASASERRTQNENRKVAVQRLRCKLAVELRPTEESLAAEHSAETKLVSEVWKKYCRDGRVDIAKSNVDWPSILAEVIGVLFRYEWNISNAATKLGTSASQLVKLLKKHPPAFMLLNQERKSRGQRPLD